MKSRDLTITNLIGRFKDRVTFSINLGIIFILLILIYSPLNKYANMCRFGIKEWLTIITLTFLVTLPFDIIKKRR